MALDYGQSSVRLYNKATFHGGSQDKKLTNRRKSS